jgi:hypothetical protein
VGHYEPAQSRPAPHLTRDVDYRHARNQPILEALVISFSMIVLNILRDRTPEMPLPLLARVDPDTLL